MSCAPRTGEKNKNYHSPFFLLAFELKGLIYPQAYLFKNRKKTRIRKLRQDGNLGFSLKQFFVFLKDKKTSMKLKRWASVENLKTKRSGGSRIMRQDRGHKTGRLLKRDGVVVVCGT